MGDYRAALASRQTVGTGPQDRVDGDRQCVTLYRQDGLSIADVAARFSALLDGAALLLCLA